MIPGNLNKAGKLILVATPIGNLGDMSPRAVEAIEKASVVFAEDTRRTAKFITEKKRLYSYHDHNAAGRLPQLKEFLQNGLTVALVSDAGMPGISDPSFKAVRIAVQEGFQIEVIPGPTAVTTALVGSGLPVDRFAFEGFLPRKIGARKRKIEEMSSYTGSIVYFIGPHHLLKYLGEIQGILGNRPVGIARELTKVHEEYIRGNISDVIRRFGDRKVRGEITIVVGGKELGEDYFD